MAGVAYPVRYTTLDGLGIDQTKLEFEPIEKNVAEELATAPKLGDIIEIAKQQIAAAAGVPSSAIRISVDLS